MCKRCLNQCKQILNVQDKMATFYVSSYYQVCQRHFPATPKLTDKQHAAFAEFDAIASRPDIAMDWVLEPGDMQFLQNHLCVHNRSAFTDHSVSPTKLSREYNLLGPLI